MALVTDYPVLSAHDHEVDLRHDFYVEHIKEIWAWLDENFGNYYDNDEWDLWEWKPANSAHFTFKYEHQAMAFKLAWL